MGKKGSNQRFNPIAIAPITNTGSTNVEHSRPFVSQVQANYLFDKNPKVALEFAKKTPDISKLPIHVGDKDRLERGLNTRD